jgi:hypothetical protein
MKSATAFAHTNAAWKVRKESVRHAGPHDPDAPTTCCGRPMESRFARAHDRLGQPWFVAVWHCPDCQRVVFQKQGP